MIYISFYCMLPFAIVGAWHIGTWLADLSLSKKNMSADELNAKIKADTTDRDVDRFLPKSLRRYE